MRTTIPLSFIAGVSNWMNGMGKCEEPSRMKTKKQMFVYILMRISENFHNSKKPLKLRIWLNPTLVQSSTLHAIDV